jgi:hypothetical protein
MDFRNSISCPSFLGVSLPALTFMLVHLYHFYPRQHANCQVSPVFQPVYQPVVLHHQLQAHVAQSARLAAAAAAASTHLSAVVPH